MEGSGPTLLVVGAGASGLSAAAAAAGVGAKVLVVDDQLNPGGRLRYTRHVVGDEAGAAEPGPAVAMRLLERIVRTGGEVRPQTAAWALFGDGGVGLAGAVGASVERPDAILLAPGSTDLPVVFRGGSLPGVMTARAARLLIEHYRVLPGKRFAIAGEGDEAEAVAVSIQAAGASVSLQSSIDDARRWSARGAEGVRSVIAEGKARDVDVIVLAAGRQPDVQLAQMGGCELVYDTSAGGWIPRRDEWMQTTMPGVFVAGDAGGLCSPEVALAEGQLAGLTAAAKGGLPVEHAIEPVRRRLEQLGRRWVTGDDGAAATRQPWRPDTMCP